MCYSLMPEGLPSLRVATPEMTAMVLRDFFHQRRPTCFTQRNDQIFDETFGSNHLFFTDDSADLSTRLGSGKARNPSTQAVMVL